MKFKLFFVTILLFVTHTTQAQITEFKEWLKNPSSDITTQKFAKKKLSKENCKEMTSLIDSIWYKTTAERLGGEWRKLVLRHDTVKLACIVRDFGRKPEDGRSLYISMHGGGKCPKEINDGQWMNHIYLYEPFEGLYVAPRAPWDDSDMWHKKGLDELLDKLIQACVVFEGVNPDKVYLLGYSAGGDGVWRVAPRMADRWAAASMMAGHPGNASQINLRNTPYMIWMGENDSAYNRNTLAKEKGETMDSLRKADPNGYIHQTHILKDKGHWMDGVDATALDWMALYRRNPYPEKIVWRQEEVLQPHFYWISAPKEELAHGKTVIIERKGNIINIEKCDYSRLTIYLNDEMFNLDKKVTIFYKGKKIKRVKTNRNIANIFRTMHTRNDLRYSFPAIIDIEL